MYCQFVLLQKINRLLRVQFSTRLKSLPDKKVLEMKHLKSQVDLILSWCVYYAFVFSFTCSCPLHLYGGDGHTRVFYAVRLLTFCRTYLMCCYPLCFCDCKLFVFVVLYHFVTALKCFHFYFVMSVSLSLYWFCLGVMLPKAF